MSLSKKKDREIAGFTFFKVAADSESWMNRARAFKEAAELIAKSVEYSPPIPYYYNAGISLELILKAIAIGKGIAFSPVHRLKDLCSLTGIKITNHQEYTLELLSEAIVWIGRYPVPKKEGQWDNYHDVVQEKHIVRELDGKTMVHRGRFPTVQNYLTIWNIFENEYASRINGEA